MKSLHRFLLTLIILLHVWLTAAEVTDNQKSFLLQLHNELRKQIVQCMLPGQPPVNGALLDLLKLWHDGLAVKAEEWSTQCSKGHDERTKRIVAPFRSVGQNYAGGYQVETGNYKGAKPYKKGTAEDCQKIATSGQPFQKIRSGFVGSTIMRIPTAKSRGVVSTTIITPNNHLRSMKSTAMVLAVDKSRGMIFRIENLPGTLRGNGSTPTVAPTGNSVGMHSTKDNTITQEKSFSRSSAAVRTTVVSFLTLLFSHLILASF
ncbi:unnamed protein product [Dicrocoelium dendriticum]|nr:unnamed protein product [Dicrocoelium dendriticum]